MRKIINLFAMLVFTACTTTTFLEEFGRLQLGMDKDDTIEHLGPPKRKEHREDKDWWYFQAYDNGAKIEKMVVFKENKIIYAGRVASSATTKDATSDDKEIDAKNSALESEMERARVSAVPMTSSPTGIQENSPP